MTVAQLIESLKEMPLDMKTDVSSINRSCFVGKHRIDLYNNHVNGGYTVRNLIDFLKKIDSDIPTNINSIGYYKDMDAVFINGIPELVPGAEYIKLS